MIFDQQNLFSDDQTVAPGASGGTVASDFKLDFGAAKRIGNGNPVCLWIKIDTEGGSSPTLAIIFRGDANSGAGGEVDLFTVREALALVSDPDIIMSYLPPLPPYEFYDLLFTTTGSSTPTFNVTAGLVVTPQTTPMIPIKPWI